MEHGRQNRSKVNGRYVSRQHAQRNPDTAGNARVLAQQAAELAQTAIVVLERYKADGGYRWRMVTANGNGRAIARLTRALDAMSNP